MKLAFITDHIRKNRTSGVGFYYMGLIKAIIKHSSHSDYCFIDHEKTPFNNGRLLFIKNIFKSKKSYLYYNFLPYLIQNQTIDFIFNIGVPHFVRFKQKEIFLYHDAGQILFPGYTTLQRYIYNKLFLRWSLHNAYKIIANSEQSEKELIDLFKVKKDKIIKMYIPYKETYLVNRRHSPNKRNHLSPFILTINTIEKRKNLTILIEAFNELKKTKKIPHKLVIIGADGHGSKEIRELAHSLEYGSEVIFTGYVSENEKYRLLSQASTFVYTPLYEGLGIPIFEAALSKIPIVSSHVPMVDEFFKKNVIFVDKRRRESIKNGIWKAINSNNHVKSCINNNYQMAIHITEDSHIKQEIAKLWESINMSG